ncbi:MAG: TonB-dependent receptor plug domain-containing protein [Bacteroidaceae bacterium]|nr:TonB-dependent receptor plug domain-containing protein [Bacteroidaceae bacterium]
MDEFVVTEKLANRAIVEGKHLKGEQIERLSNNSIADALRYFSGLQVKDYGGVGGLKTVNIRSMGTNHLGIFYDGIELGNAQNGVIDLGQFSLDNVDEISLYNGQKSQIFQPASDFGNAGSVYIRTRRPIFTDKPYHLRFRLKGGSFDMIRFSAVWDQRISPTVSSSINAEFLNASGKYKFRYMRKKADGTIAYDTTATRENGDVWALKAEGNVHGTIERGGWNVKLYTYQSQRGIPGAIVNNVWRRGERQTDSNNFIQGTWQKTVTDRFDTQLRAKYAYYKTHYLNRDTTIMQVDNTYHQHELYFSTANAYEIKPWWTASLSYDFKWNRLTASPLARRETLLADAYRISNLLSVATAFDFNWIKLQASLLNTWVSDRSNTDGKTQSQTPASSNNYNLTPAVFLSFCPSQVKWLKLNLYAKKSFRMPTFNDLYYTEIGNANLKPETAIQYNGGITVNPLALPKNALALSLSVNAYYNTIHDKIVAYPRGQQFRWTMLNLGKVHITGVDVETDVAALLFKQLMLTLRLQYTYQDARDVTDPSTSYYNHQIPYIPWHSGSAIFNLEWRNLSINYSFVYAGKRYNQQENIPRNEMLPWYTSDVSVSYKLKQWRFTLDVNNLLSQDYDVILNYPMPKINFAATAAYEI